MLTVLASIYVAGTFIIYSGFAYFTLRSGNGNERNTSLEYEQRDMIDNVELIPLLIDEYYSLSDSDDGDDELFDEDTLNWEAKTNLISTFKEAELTNPSSLKRPSSLLHQKSVRFSPFSFKHSTFTFEDYPDRRNQEWKQRVARLQENKEDFQLIQLEILKFKVEEMEVYKEAAGSDLKETDILTENVIG